VPSHLTAAIRAALPDVLIALDFDGTLAPIVVDPASSRPAPGAIEALTALASAGVHVGIVTGRDARTVVALGGLDAVPGLIVAGLYGAEWWQGGQLSSPAEPASIAALRARLPETVASHATDPHVRIEDKGLSLVVHTRPAADPAAELETLRPHVTGLAGELGLEVHDGRAVLEVRMPGHDKGNALRRLVECVRPRAVLFAGDDLGDLPAFAVVRELRAAGLPAWAVAASSAEAPEVAAAADVHVDGPAGVVEMLAALTR
jgi:trehalose 6-phosphate phosphatase